MAKNDDGWFEGVIEPGIRGLFPVSPAILIQPIFLIIHHLFREIMLNLYVNETKQYHPSHM